MSISVLLSPAPGWYPDPAGIAEYRWWDGDTWTEGTHGGAQDTPVAAAAPAVDVTQGPASALVAEFESTLKPPIRLFADPVPDAGPAPTSVAESAPAAAPASAQAEPASARPAPARRPAAPSKTRWSSMLLAFPFVYPLVVGMVVALGYAGGAASSIPVLVVLAVIAGIGALVPAWVFADHDRRELTARGYEPAPSIAWMLLLPPIAYLLARRRVVGRPS